jgi:hypothetical protein
LFFTFHTSYRSSLSSFNRINIICAETDKGKEKLGIRTPYSHGFTARGGIIGNFDQWSESYPRE